MYITKKKINHHFFFVPETYYNIIIQNIVNFFTSSSCLNQNKYKDLGNRKEAKIEKKCETNNRTECICT